MSEKGIQNTLLVVLIPIGRNASLGNRIFGKSNPYRVAEFNIRPLLLKSNPYRFEKARSIRKLV